TALTSTIQPSVRCLLQPPKFPNSECGRSWQALGIIRRERHQGSEYSRRTLLNIPVYPANYRQSGAASMHKTILVQYRQIARKWVTGYCSVPSLTCLLHSQTEGTKRWYTTGKGNGYVRSINR
ncbi:unnamed protein product, partial [Ectocarpus sp. 8 AP-2014]